MSVKERARHHAVVGRLIGHSVPRIARSGTPIVFQKFSPMRDRRTPLLRDGQARRRHDLHKIWSIFQGSRAK